MRQLGLRPTDFYSLDPRRFWWLVETLAHEGGGGARGGLSDPEKDELLALLRDAKKGNT